MTDPKVYWDYNINIVGLLCDQNVIFSITHLKNSNVIYYIFIPRLSHNTDVTIPINQGWSHDFLSGGAKALMKNILRLKIKLIYMKIVII
jgi:hypothetical protein